MHTPSSTGGLSTTAGTSSTLDLYLDQQETTFSTNRVSNIAQYSSYTKVIKACGARVLTSAAAIVMMEEKQRKKQEEEEAKEQRKREQEEKKLQKNERKLKKDRNDRQIKRERQKRGN